VLLKFGGCPLLLAAITLVHLSWPAASGYLRIFLSGDLLRNHARMLTWNAVG